MRLLLKWLLRLATAGAGIVALALVLGLYLVQRSLPDYSAELEMRGLGAEVRIIRDAHAVPHIRGETAQDAMFALGVAHAQDRLWQMELSRRAAQGRLSELLGARTVPLDRLVKTLDLYGYARRSLSHQSPEAQAFLEAYAEGVNAWIAHVFREALGRGAPEFFLFGTDGIAPWTPSDSLAVLKMMALRLGSAAQHDIRRARFLLSLPPERVADILPEAPEGAVTELPRYAAIFEGARFAEAEPAAAEDPLLAALGPAPRPELAGASNAWAVDGSRSATGRPLLASDPHLWLSAPSLWYLASLEGGDLSVIGGTLPGAPVVLIGRNRAVGWGLTTVGVDDQDVFIERLDPEEPSRYRTPDGWKAFETRTDRIVVRDGPPVSLTLRRSRNGPVLDGDLFGVDAVVPDGHVAALRWTALTDEDRTMSAAIGLMRAGSVDDALDQARDVLAPAQNVTVADGRDIGMAVAGAIPERRADSPSRGRVPSPGWLAETEWTGLRPAERNPRIRVPRTGALANANNRLTDDAYPEHISNDWDLPYRIQRLEKELSAREFHSLNGFLALQNDAVSEMARSMLPLIARDLWWRQGSEVAEPSGPIARRAAALALLAQWNGDMDRNRPEPLIFAEWMRQLTRRLAADELGPLMPLVEGIRPLFVERAFRDVDGAAIWCDVDKTPERESCDDIAASALDQALARLSRDYGPNIEGWRWGAAHRAEHRHTPLGYVGPLGFLFSITQETSGGDFTLLRGAVPGDGPEPFRNVHASGLRVIYDFADLDRSLMIIATGQSGHPLSRHYDDLSELWGRGDMIRMSLSTDDALIGSLGVTVLRPPG